MSNNVTDAEKQKKDRAKTATMVVVYSIILFGIAYFLGNKRGYNKGFDKGVGWQ